MDTWYRHDIDVAFFQAHGSMVWVLLSGNQLHLAHSSPRTFGQQSWPTRHPAARATRNDSLWLCCSPARKNKEQKQKRPVIEYPETKLVTHQHARKKLVRVIWNGLEFGDRDIANKHRDISGLPACAAPPWHKLWRVCRLTLTCVVPQFDCCLHSPWRASVWPRSAGLEAMMWFEYQEISWDFFIVSNGF